MVSRLPVVDYSQAAALATPASRPTQLAQAPATRYDLSPIGAPGQRELHLRIVIVIQQLPDQPCERRRLNKFHTPYNTPLADTVNSASSLNLSSQTKSARSARRKVSWGSAASPWRAVGCGLNRTMKRAETADGPSCRTLVSARGADARA